MIFAQTLPFDRAGMRNVLWIDTVHDLSSLSDEALLEQALSTPSVFEVLLARYQKEFLERAMYVVKSRDEAEDVVQDAFVRIYRFAPRFKAEHGSFRSWAMTILMNVARTRYQKQAKGWVRNVELSNEHYESLAAPSEKDALLAHDALERALTLLPEDISRLLRWAFIDGLSYEEIGEREGISAGAVKTRVHRAKKALKKVLDNQGYN